MVGHGQPLTRQRGHYITRPACILLVLDDRTPAANGASCQDQAPVHGMSSPLPLYVANQDLGRVPDLSFGMSGHVRLVCELWRRPWRPEPRRSSNAWQCTGLGYAQRDQ
jgi:hypothetical protein